MVAIVYMFVITCSKFSRFNFSNLGDLSRLA